MDSLISVIGKRCFFIGLGGGTNGYHIRAVQVIGASVGDGIIVVFALVSGSKKKQTAILPNLVNQRFHRG